MKKMLSGFLAASMAAGMGLTAFADYTTSAVTEGGITFDTVVYDSDRKPTTLTLNKGTIEGIRPDSTYYLKINELDDSTTTTKVDVSGGTHNTFKGLNILGDPDYFKNKIEKSGDGKSLISSAEIVNDKKDENGDRGTWVKIQTKQSFMDTEKKAELNITLTTKSRSDEKEPTGFTQWNVNDKFTAKINLWVNNEIVNGSEQDVDTGYGFVFNPQANETNSVIWGEDRAALKFDADNNASKFYAKLSTKANTSIYAQYADPIGAELWFYDFVGRPTVPSTSRGTLTLGVPWDEDDAYAPNVKDVYIYEVDADGNLVDVTANFTYSEDETDIAGWSMKTRTLGSYVISDMKLELDEPENTEETSKPEDADKEIPSTGSSDLLNLAVFGAIASLAAAGAAAFKKSAK